MIKYSNHKYGLLSNKCLFSDLSIYHMGPCIMQTFFDDVIIVSWYNDNGEWHFTVLTYYTYKSYLWCVQILLLHLCSFLPLHVDFHHLNSFPLTFQNISNDTNFINGY